MKNSLYVLVMLMVSSSAYSMEQARPVPKNQVPDFKIHKNGGGLVTNKQGDIMSPHFLGYFNRDNGNIPQYDTTRAAVNNAAARNRRK